MYSEHALSRPSLSQPVRDGSGAQVQMARPLGHAHRFSSERQASISAGVVQLLAWCRPSAIGRLVVSITINAIQRVRAGRSAPNVSQECGEVISPFAAHGYATTAVAVVSGRIGVVAPRLHVHPRGVLAAVATMRRVAVTCHALSLNVFLQAPTTLRISAPEVTRFDDFLGSAVAAAQPASGPRWWARRRPLNDSQASIAGADHMRILPHKWAKLDTPARAQAMAEMIRTGAHTGPLAA
jgi:hypothetical protein